MVKYYTLCACMQDGQNNFWGQNNFLDTGILYVFCSLLLIFFITMLLPQLRDILKNIVLLIMRWFNIKIKKYSKSIMFQAFISYFIVITSSFYCKTWGKAGVDGRKGRWDLRGLCFALICFHFVILV